MVRKIHCAYGSRACPIPFYKWINKWISKIATSLFFVGLQQWPTINVIHNINVPSNAYLMYRHVILSIFLLCYLKKEKKKKKKRWAFTSDEITSLRLCNLWGCPLSPNYHFSSTLPRNYFDLWSSSLMHISITVYKIACIIVRVTWPAVNNRSTIDIDYRNA